jgi:putative ABC transport system ATP-binding protein
LFKVYRVGEQEVHALNGVSVNIDQGEFLSIIGPSGAGKSTLMDIMGLLDTATSGTHFFNGEDVSNFDDNKRSDLRNREIGFTFQSFFLLPALTTLQNVMLPLTYRDMPTEEMQQQAAQMLTKVGLSDRINHKPTELSGGQQQRVAIARSLVTRPKLILADEPTGALDSKTSADIISLLQSFHQEDNVTVIIVTHDEKIAANCPRQLHIKDGQVTDSNAPGEEGA